MVPNLPAKLGSTRFRLPASDFAGTGSNRFRPAGRRLENPRCGADILFTPMQAGLSSAPEIFFGLATTEPREKARCSKASHFAASPGRSLWSRRRIITRRMGRAAGLIARAARSQLQGGISAGAARLQQCLRLLPFLVLKLLCEC
jgi:hypothetical protein